MNEVLNAYNSFQQLTAQYQEHSGSVTTGTTPKVQYGYADGGANTIRPMTMTYPNGRVLEYRYDDSAADKLSRVRTLRWNGTDVCRYSYVGLSTFVTTDYLQPQVKLDFALGGGSNPYAGFDRFGRIIDLLWTKYNAISSSSSSSSSSLSSSSGSPGNSLVHLRYGYDRAGNRTYREDLVAQSYGKQFDELYTYDGLHRLRSFDRGLLSSDHQTITNPIFDQDWQLDATGNWQGFIQNDFADPSQTLDQQRVHNKVNEITQIARTVGSNWATPEYDRNGNMTVIPQPKEMTSTFQGTWDAWNRLVKLEEPNGSGGWRILAEYQYDGQPWRTVAKSYDAGVLDETRHFYLTSQWQDIEERLGSTPSIASADQQFAWGQRHIDDLILRDRATSGSSVLDERLYGLQDDTWNIVAIAESLGHVQERYAYSAYGESAVLTPTLAGRPNSSFEWETRFASYRLDSPSELHFVRHRYLHSSLGHWTSRDPFRQVAGQLQTQSGKAIRLNDLLDNNLYRYVVNNPLLLTDPTGLMFACVGLTGGVTAFAGLTPGAWGFGASISVSFYGCFGYTKRLGLYCGNCAVGTLTIMPLGVGGYASIGAGPTIMFNPLDVNKPSEGHGIAFGTGGGLIVSGISVEVTVDIDIVSGDTTISIPKFGFGAGIYVAFRVSGTCTACTPGMWTKIKACFGIGQKAAKQALATLQSGLPYTTGREKQVIKIKGEPADSGDIPVDDTRFL